MPIPASVVLPLLRNVRHNLAADVSLAALARTARRSVFELHRAFRRVTGETTKHYTSRLRLDHAAAELLLGARPILEIALDSGFASHEVFTRAFLRRFGMSPRAYLSRGLAGDACSRRECTAIAAHHAAIVREAGPCIGLYHLTMERKPDMSVTVTREQLDPRTALVIRRRTPQSTLARTLAELLPRVFAHAT